MSVFLRRLHCGDTEIASLEGPHSIHYFSPNPSCQSPKRKLCNRNAHCASRKYGGAKRTQLAGAGGKAAIAQGTVGYAAMARNPPLKPRSRSRCRQPSPSRHCLTSASRGVLFNDQLVALKLGVQAAKPQRRRQPYTNEAGRYNRAVDEQRIQRMAEPAKDVPSDASQSVRRRSGLQTQP